MSSGTILDTHNTPETSIKSQSLSMEVLDATGTEFKVFDGTGFKGKPDMSEFGIRPIEVIYTNQLWPTKRNDSNRWEFVSGSRAASLAREAAELKSRAVMVDVQNWPTDEEAHTVRKSTRRLSALYYDLKRAAPNTNFGYFNSLPIKNWWRNAPSGERLDNWRTRNDRLRGLAEKVDAFYLPGYTKSEDQDRWVRNMKYLIEEAKRINNGQPIYVVLWPQYPPRASNDLRGTYLDKGFWQLQLETVKKYADGIVLYSPHGTPWDEAAPWWEVTKQFMEELGEYSAEPKVSDTEFKVFDGTRFRNKPEMSQFGFTPIKVIYEMMIWDKPMNEVGRWQHPTKRLVTEWAHKASEVNNEIAMINIEHWPTSKKGMVTGNVQMSINKYSMVYDWFKEAEPEMDFGYYKTVPHKVHWRSYPQPHWISSITKTNDRLSPLANKVDAYFLSAYTRSKEKKGWIINTKYNIKQAHRYNGDKPVYLVLWPQYYAIDNSSLEDQYIEKDFWKLQLETARKYADGVVIWFPYDTKWSEASNAPWWDVTKKFLQDMGKGG